MNLKTRIALNLSIAFSIIMGIVMTVIYISFANFRKAEFKENLEHSAVVTANYISKLPQVTIIHGKGTGALRKAVHAYLKMQKNVKSFRPGAYGEGEAGVTIVEL